MSRTFRLLILSLLAVLVACASSPTIRADYDRTANFSAYRTFGFFPQLGTDTSGYESLITQTLKSAVRQEMESRGYVYSEPDADILINFNAKLAKQTEVSSMPAPAYYGYRGGWYGGWGGYQTYVDQYVEGTLNIDMVDSRQKRLVWEGVAIGRVTKKTQEDRQAAIRAAVAEIFAKYPFRAGG